MPEIPDTFDYTHVISYMCEMYGLTDDAGTFQKEVNRICRQDGDENQKNSETQIYPIVFTL